MHVIYTGPFDEVDVPALNLVAVPRGKPIEVGPEAGEVLCQQEHWEQANGRRNRKPATETEGTDD